MEQSERVEDVPEVAVAQLGQHRTQPQQQRLQPGTLRLRYFYNNDTQQYFYLYP
jgi:hypothetical protein